MQDKRFTPVLFVAAWLAAALLSGCGGATGPGATVVATPSDEPGPPLPAITIGSIASETGAAAAYGLPQLRGSLLAVEQLEAAGFWDATFTSIDDRSTESGGLVAMERLLEGGADVILGPTLSTVAAAADPLAQAAGVPVLAIINSTLDLDAVGDVVWRVALSERQTIARSVGAAAELYGIENVAIIVDETDGHALDVGDIYEEAAAANGLTVASRVTFDPEIVDFETLLIAATDDGVDALLLAAHDETATRLLFAIEEQGLPQVRIGSNGFLSTEVVTLAGSAAEWLIVTAAWNADSDTPGNAEFVAAYEARWDEPPDTFAAQAYAGVQILAAAVEAARGGTTPEQILAGLAALDTVETILGPVSFDGREAQYSGVTQMVSDGFWVVVGE